MKNYDIYYALGHITNIERKAHSFKGGIAKRR